MRILFSVLVFVGIGGQVVAQTANIVQITAPVTSKEKSVKPVGEACAYTITGSYAGAPALQNSEEVPVEAEWCASANGGGTVVSVIKGGSLEIGNSYPWQTSNSFSFGFVSSKPGSYTLTLSISLRIAIRHKVTNNFIRWAYCPTVTGEPSTPPRLIIWIGGSPHPTNKPNTNTTLPPKLALVGY